MAEDAALTPDFRLAYEDLVSRMQALADADGDVFLPNPEPAGPVDYVFICMEPSLGGWARGDAEVARAKVAEGFHNFVYLDHGTLPFHFAIRQYLCRAHESYHLTDMSKGAMPVKSADIDRDQRWERWYPLLLEELNLVAKEQAHIFPVGQRVEDFLRRHMFPRGLHKAILHYSSRWPQHRKRAIIAHEAEFERFKASLSRDQVLATAEEVMAGSLPSRWHEEALARSTPLRESDKQLIFTYKLAFSAALAPAAQSGFH